MERIKMERIQILVKRVGPLFILVGPFLSFLSKKIK